MKQATSQKTSKGAKEAVARNTAQRRSQAAQTIENRRDRVVGQVPSVFSNTYTTPPKTLKEVKHESRWNAFKYTLKDLVGLAIIMVLITSVVYLVAILIFFAGS